MTIFWSCHIIVNRKLAYDRRHVVDFIDADLHLGGISTLFLELTPSTNANIFLAHLRNALNISTASAFLKLENLLITVANLSQVQA